ncbi:MAG TPA: hypothetical protein VFW87_18950, partial [Pirellulales bacterium]|nr:hypothetical protein [Pirellulales bacterium]
MRPSLELLEERELLSAVNWTVDQANSSTTITLPDQNITLNGITATVKIRNNDNSAWSTGRTAQMSGTIATDYVDGSSIQFQTGLNNLLGVNSGNYIPDPALWDGTTFTSDTATGPGVFGGKIRATALFITADVGWFNFDDVHFDAGSGPLAITGNSFPANTTTMGASSLRINALGAADVLGQGQVLPDTQTTVTGVTATNTAATGTVQSTGLLTRKLTMPVNIPISVEIPGDNPGDPPVATITGTITGSIVANATLPPPNSSTVTGRRLFYGNSAYATAFSDDNSAIATDKVAYIPSGSNTVGPQNVSS